jgi:zinc protease
MKGWIILALSLFVNALTPQECHAGIFNPITTTLPNGLQVVLVQNHLAPIVSVNIIYKVRAFDV